MEGGMADVNDSDGTIGGRGPAYPFIPLEKAVDRVQQVYDAGLSRQAFAPVSFYKAWGYEKESGNARQTMAALGYFGLLENRGRGKERKVELSRLARRIILDRVPNSTERLEALREAALMPTAYRKLFDQYGPTLVPDYAMETFLMRDLEYPQSGAKGVISGYRDTFAYARLADIDTMTDDEPADQPQDQPKPDAPEVVAFSSGIKEPAMQPVAEAGRPAAPISGMQFPTASENEIKVMLDGPFLRVSAVVDARGAKKLMKALKANIALLSDDDDEESDFDN
jgi:hypothetical protein